MKILNSNNINSQSFNGLWGKTYLKTDVDCVLGVPMRREEKYYFPFSDETNEEIQQIISERKKAMFVNDYQKYLYYDCILGEKLPFNQQQYDAYMSVGEDFKTDRDLRDRDKWFEEIHQHVRNKFLTEEYGKRQIPAYNPIIEAKTLNSYI